MFERHRAQTAFSIYFSHLFLESSGIPGLGFCDKLLYVLCVCVCVCVCVYNIIIYIKFLLNYLIGCQIFFPFFLVLQPWHMEVLRLGV